MSTKQKLDGDYLHELTDPNAYPEPEGKYDVWAIHDDGTLSRDFVMEDASHVSSTLRDWSESHIAFATPHITYEMADEFFEQIIKAGKLLEAKKKRSK